MMKKAVFCLGILMIVTQLSAGDRALRVSPVVEAVRKAKPAVVNISTEKVVSVNTFNPFGNDWIYEFFRPYSRRNITQQSLGSGIIINPDGIILTNEHIILPASKIKVTCTGGKELEARLLGASRRFDLALLKIDAPEPLPFVPPGKSDDLMIGETVIAIGNPFGLNYTVTTGVVSALNRTVEFEDPETHHKHTYYDFIQTDASINPGNSGGPLLNILGELIGVNSAIYANAEGIGFAIPIDRAKRVIDDLLQTGNVPLIWLGIRVQDLTPLLVRQLNIQGSGGVLISEIRKDSPGARAELTPGDVILSVGKQAVNSSREFWEQIRQYTPGDTVVFEVNHKGSCKEVSVVAEEFPLNRMVDLAWDIIGLNVSKINNPIIRRFGLYVKSGVFVARVRPGSPADEVGIKRGDVIVQVDGGAIERPRQFYKAIRKAAHRDSVTFVVVRRTAAYRVTLELD